MGDKSWHDFILELVESSERKSGGGSWIDKVPDHVLEDLEGAPEETRREILGWWKEELTREKSEEEKELDRELKETL